MGDSIVTNSSHTFLVFELEKKRTSEGEVCFVGHIGRVFRSEALILE